MGWLWRLTSALNDTHEATCFGKGFRIGYVKCIKGCVRAYETSTEFPFLLEFWDMEQEAQYCYRGSSWVQAGSEERHHAKAWGPDMEVNDSEPVSIKSAKDST